jgi:hypothetical protein
MSRPGMIWLMSHLRTPSSRTLTVVLSESEWRALREIEPDAVGWMQERIRERLGVGSSSDAKPNGNSFPGVTTEESCWGEDEY